jgi:hypothetical protein
MTIAARHAAIDQRRQRDGVRLASWDADGKTTSISALSGRWLVGRRESVPTSSPEKRRRENRLGKHLSLSSFLRAAATKSSIKCGNSSSLMGGRHLEFPSSHGSAYRNRSVGSALRLSVTPTHTCEGCVIPEISVFEVGFLSQTYWLEANCPTLGFLYSALLPAPAGPLILAARRARPRRIISGFRPHSVCFSSGWPYSSGWM